MTFIFYDTETTGISTAFDQILQFASITTDSDLNETDRFEIRSRLLPYIVPSPHALRVTGQTIDDLLDESRPSHYEMVTEIRRALGCPAMFVGYNSLTFDEEILRQAFYCCLYPPYLTNTAGNKRADAMHLIRAAAVLHPDALARAFNDKGRPSFKLDRLAPANGFSHVNAHDALADVEALIHLCRIVRDRCPALWARFQQFASKMAVEDFLRDERAFLLLEFHPISTRRYFVTSIGSGNGSVAYCYDLMIDPAELKVLTDAELTSRLAKSPRTLRRVKTNAAPCLCSLADAPLEMLDELSADELFRRAQEVRSDQALVDRLVAAAIDAETTYPPSPHVEKRIYDGFWSRRDEQRLEAFHAVPWEERVAIAESLEDHRLAWLARRLIYVERPELLALEHRNTMASEKARRMMAEPAECAGWTTLCRAAADLAQLLDGQNAQSASSLNAYFNLRRDEVRRFLGGSDA